MNPAELPTWNQTPDGWRHSVCGALLRQNAKGRWTLHYRGEVVQLPRKTSFDHADKALLKMGVSQ